MKKLFPFALILISGAASAADKLVGGPYTVNVSQNSATVAWIVESGKVAAGLSADKLDLTTPVLRVEKTTYTSLQPGKTYYYDVTGTPEGKGQFKTAPQGAVPFEFVAYGDNRTRADVHQRVINTLLSKAKPDFVVQTGDMVENGANSALWPTFFSIEKELLRKAPIFAALGNHERNNRQYYEFFDAESGYYAFNWGTSHFIVLNTDIGNTGPVASAKDEYWQKEVKWLEEDLAAHQTSDFRFVFGHHPPMTAVASRQGNNKHITALMPMFEKYKVTAAIFGHDHNYQHYLSNGIHYVVTGGGGAPLYDVSKPPAGITQKVESIENFVQLKVDGPTVHVQAWTIDGKPLDSWDMRK